MSCRKRPTFSPASSAALASSRRPAADAPIRHIEFVRISAEQALAVIVAESGEVENRVLALPPGLPASSLIEAGNYLNARMKGRTLAEAREAVLDEVRSRKALLDQTASQLVEDGLAQWSGEDPAAAAR